MFYIEVFCSASYLFTFRTWYNFVLMHHLAWAHSGFRQLNFVTWRTWKELFVGVHTHCFFLPIMTWEHCLDTELVPHQELVKQVANSILNIEQTGICVLFTDVLCYIDRAADLMAQCSFFFFSCWTALFGHCWWALSVPRLLNSATTGHVAGQNKVIMITQGKKPDMAS